MSNGNPLYSTMVRSGKTSYFIDVKEAKNGNRYLMISETRLDGGERKRQSIRVFDGSVAEFAKAIDEAVATISG